jgi:hypothetical protein
MPGVVKGDTVRATAIWSSVTALHDKIEVDEILNVRYPDLKAPEFADKAEGLVGTRLAEYGGTGLRERRIPFDERKGEPVFAGIYNVILVTYTVEPVGIWKVERILVDSARRVDNRVWVRAAADDPWGEPDPGTINNAKLNAVASQLELANDDGKPEDRDETRKLTPDDHYHSVDAPGPFWYKPRDVTHQHFVQKSNFNEWLRIAFAPSGTSAEDRGKQRPKDNRVAGSRASANYFWHAALTLSNDEGEYQRTTGNTFEVHGVNDVGPDHIPLTPP